MIWLVIFTFCVAYIPIGIFVDEWIETDGFAVIGWPIVLLFCVVAKPIAGIASGIKYLQKMRTEYKKSKIPPTPTDILVSTVCTLMIQRPDCWVVSELWDHKEKGIQYDSDKVSNTLVIDNNKISLNDEQRHTLKVAANKSYGMKKAFAENKKKAENENLALDMLAKLNNISTEGV